MFCSLCSVYAPLSIRLVQNCTSPGWRNIRDVLDLLPGPSFEEIQRVHPSSLRFVLVYYICTWEGVNYGGCWCIRLNFKMVYLSFGNRKLTKTLILFIEVTNVSWQDLHKIRPVQIRKHLCSLLVDVHSRKFRRFVFCANKKKVLLSIWLQPHPW